MDPLNQNQNYNTPPSKSSVGAMIAILIIVILLVLGALYVFGTRQNIQNTPENTNTQTNFSPNTFSDEVATGTPESIIEDINFGTLEKEIGDL